jgi:hypothetical protein
MGTTRLATWFEKLGLFPVATQTVLIGNTIVSDLPNMRSSQTVLDKAPVKADDSSGFSTLSIR